MEAAIFVAISGTLTDEAAKSGVDGHALQPAASGASSARALACNTPMKFAARRYDS
jgi:hypothetical protein